MPEIFDLDTAFEKLAEDVGAHTHRPGADRASNTARRRRTANVGLGALALLVAGGVGLQQLGHHETVIQPAGLPTSQVLTADVLDSVTSGWISDWAVPTDPKQLDANLTTAGDACLNSIGGSDDDIQPVHTGFSVFLSGGAVALARGAQAPSEAAAVRLMAGASLSGACHNVQSSSPTTDTDLITATASDAHGYAVIGVVRWKDRFAFLAVSDPSAASPAAVQDALGNAVLAAIQDDSTVTFTTPVLAGAIVDGSSTSTGYSSSGGGPAYSMKDPTGADLKTAFGGWAAGYDPGTGAMKSVSSPTCLQNDGSLMGSGASVGNAVIVGLSTFTSATDAGDGFSAKAQALTSCGFRVEGPTAAGVLMGTRGGGKPMTIWFVRDVVNIASVQVDGWTDPPQTVTGAVGGLLITAVATAKVSTEPPAPVVSAQSEPPSAMSTSASASVG